MVRRQLECAGFVIHEEKSHWISGKSTEWLSFNTDLTKGEFSVSTNKLDILKSQLHVVAVSSAVPARQLASMIGKIMSMLKMLTLEVERKLLLTSALKRKHCD